jgi:hypothetical protein
MRNAQNGMRVIISHEEPRLAVSTLMWAGFWTGVLLFGFALLVR